MKNWSRTGIWPEMPMRGLSFFRSHPAVSCVIPPLDSTCLASSMVRWGDIGCKALIQKLAGWFHCTIMVWMASLLMRWCTHHVIIFANTISSLQLTVFKVLAKHFKPSPSFFTSNITLALPTHTSSSSPQLPLRLGAWVHPMDSRHPCHHTNQQQKGAWWGHHEETYPSGCWDLHQRVPSIWSSARRTAWILFSRRSCGCSFCVQGCWSWVRHCRIAWKNYSCCSISLSGDFVDLMDLDSFLHKDETGAKEAEKSKKVVEASYEILLSCSALIGCYFWTCDTEQKTLLPSDKIWILWWRINKWLLYFWLQEITEDRVRIHMYLFKRDKRLWCISPEQNLNMVIGCLAWMNNWKF